MSEEIPKTYFISHRQMRALGLYEQVMGCSIGGGSMEDVMKRYRDAEAWLDRIAEPSPSTPTR